MAETKVYTKRDPAGLTRTVVIWLWLDLVIKILGAGTTLFQVQFRATLDPNAPATMMSPPDGPLVIDLAASVAALLNLAAMVVVGVLVLKWIYRTNRNAHALADGLQISPPWAVGWYFVPIGNLWKPFQAMRETWQVSADPKGWSSVAVPGLLRWWWGLWLVSNWLSAGSFRLAADAHTVGALLVSDFIDLIVAAIDMPLVVVLILIVRRLGEMQVRALHEQAIADPTSPAPAAVL
jgi:hypothetical protein